LLFKFGCELFGGSPGFSLAGQIAYTGIVGGFLLFIVAYLLWVLFFLGAIAVRDAPRAFTFPT